MISRDTKTSNCKDLESKEKPVCFPYSRLVESSDKVVKRGPFTKGSRDIKRTSSSIAGYNTNIRFMSLQSKLSHKGLSLRSQTVYLVVTYKQLIYLLC